MIQQSSDSIQTPPPSSLRNGRKPATTPDSSAFDWQERLQDEIRQVADLLPPVWPLRDYVAVNPWMGLADRRFATARRLLQSVSDVEMLRSSDDYRPLFLDGSISEKDIREAVEEFQQDDGAFAGTADDVLEFLRQPQSQFETESSRRRRRIRSIAEITDETTGSDWGEFIREEMGRFCGAHFDQGQAAWPSPWRHLNLYLAWKSAALEDLRGPLSGLSEFRSTVRSLPHTPEAAIAWALRTLDLPVDLWGPYLLCQAFSVSGWCSWARYQDDQSTLAGEEAVSLESVLAIRLAYEVAISRSAGIRINWDSLLNVWRVSGQRIRYAESEESVRGLVLLRAHELAYQRTLLRSLQQPVSEHSRGRQVPASNMLAQLVFCIDVRSERIRRHLEETSDHISTLGFAGFFGVPVARKPLEQETAIPHVPALLTPSVTVPDVPDGFSDQAAERAVHRLRLRQTLEKWWKQLQSSVSGCFGFVEAAGLTFAGRLWMQTRNTGPRLNSVLSNQLPTRPDLSALEQHGWSMSDQTDLAESILKGMGLTSSFAPLVVLCGHTSSVVNNPLQASLDCGACCGHSGEFNARFAAQLLNQPFIRSELRQRGIDIPDEAWFTAAVHNTTTDELTFPDADMIPVSRREEFRQLTELTEQASALCRHERMPNLGVSTSEQLIARATDWSEARPEWGLAGNASFLVGPRDWTRSINLDGRTFLHSYDYRTDTGFEVLQQILTAPMVVAHWINMQYYASTVDNRRLGSGSKAIHNVVGRFGIFSGNGGDLQTGLPLQSVSDGQRLQHQPLRLLAVIRAPQAAVEEVLQRHTAVEDLVVNQWMNLIVCDHDGFFRYTPRRDWQAVPDSHLREGASDNSSWSADADSVSPEPLMQGV